MRLSLKLVAVFSSFAALSVAMVGALTYRSERATLETAAFANLNAIAETAESQILAWIAMQASHLRLVPATRPLQALRDAVPGTPPAARAEEALRRDLTAWTEGPQGFLSLFVIDPADGRVIVSTDERETGTFKENRPYFLKGRDGPAIQGPYYSLTRRAPSMVVSRPVLVPPGPVLGILAGRVNLSHLHHQIARLMDRHESMDIYVVNRTGLFVTQPRYATGPAILQRQVHTGPVTRCLAGDSGAVRAEDYRGRPVLSVFRWLPERGLCLVTELGSNEALRPTRALRRTIAVAGLVSLALAWAAAFVTARRLTRPIERLGAGAAEIAAGRLDYRLPATSADELGDLARQFNAMAADIQSRQTALQDSESRFRAIADYTYDWELWMGPDGRTRWINPAVERVTGYSVASGMAMDDYPLPLFHVDDRAAMAAHRRKALAGDIADGVVCRLVCNNGRILWLSISYQPIFDTEETFMGSRWSLRDVSERVKAEKALRDSEQRIRAMSQSAADAIISIDDGMAIVSWNRGAERIFGYGESEALGRPVEILMPAAYRTAHRQGVTRFIEGSGGRILDRPAEFEGMHKDGTTFPIELSLSTWQMDDRTYFTAVIRDITERKRADVALRESEATNRAIMDAALDGIVTMDHRGIVIDFNPAAQSVFGYRREDIVGKPMADHLIPAAHRAAHDAGLKRYLETGTGRVLNQRLAVSAVRADGTEFPAELAITVIRRQGPPLFTGYIRDITEEQAAEQALADRTAALERSNGELQQFAYVASHDLQEPLRMVSSYVQLLERRYGRTIDDQGREFIAFAVDGAQRMRSLINDLLKYSRVDTMGAELVPVDAEEPLAAALANLKLAIEEAGARLTHAPLPRVLADTSQIASLFQNLIGNALKYRDSVRPPQIHIDVRRVDTRWEFSIRDNGIGIEPEFYERVFMIFQRLHGPGEYSGTGIGLAVCKKIVERHGGRIWVESVPGEGSTFFFTLRAAHDAVEKA